MPRRGRRGRSRARARPRRPQGDTRTHRRGPRAAAHRAAAPAVARWRGAARPRAPAPRRRRSRRRRRRCRGWRGPAPRHPPAPARAPHGSAAVPGGNTAPTPRAARRGARQPSPRRRHAPPSPARSPNADAARLRCGSSACSVVSIEGRSGVSPSTRPAVGSASSRSIPARTPARSTGTKTSPPSAARNCLPEALIHNAPSRLIDVLPPAAWTSSGSEPRRADSATNDRNSESCGKTVIAVTFPGGPCARRARTRGVGRLESIRRAPIVYGSSHFCI